MKLYDKSLSTVYEQGRPINLWGMFFPKLLELFSAALLGSVYSLLLANFDEEAAVAVSVSSQIQTILSYLLLIFCNGHQITANIYLGANNRKAAGISASSSLAVSIILSLAAGLILSFFPKPFMQLMHLEGKAFEYGCTYLSIGMAFSVFSVFRSCFNAFLISVGRVKCVLLVTILGNVLSIAFGYIVLFRPFETPLYGVSGVAIGAGLASVFCAVVSGIFVIGYKCPMEPRIEFSAILQTGKIGLPGSMCSIAYVFSQTVASSMISSLGLTMISAKVFANNILSFIPLFSLAVGQSGKILIGRYKGQENHTCAEKLLAQNIILALMLNLPLIVVICIFCHPLFSLFTKDPVTLALIGKIVFIDILVEAGRAVNHIIEPALVAVGDVRFVTILSTISCWAISIGGGWLLGVVLGIGIAGFWIAFAADELFRVCGYLLRWRTGHWKNIKI